MTTLKQLLTLTLAGALAPAAAHAEIGTPTVTKVLAAPTNDTAPVSGTPARLRRTDSEQAGNEQVTHAFFSDNKRGLLFSMNTELNGVAANHRVQLALVPFSLVQDATTGAVSAQPDMASAKYVTNNQGNEYRNAHHPVAFPIFGGKLIAVKYNYQPNNANDTKTYMQIFNDQGVAVMPQTKIFEKQNDDCSMNQDSAFADTRQLSATKVRMAGWYGCNGNGADDGWVGIGEITCDEQLTQCSYDEIADLSVCPREERSHGAVSFGTDPDTVIATWTEGNTQPQRDGTWIAAIHVGDGETGDNAQSRLLWKKQVDGRKEYPDFRTYSMRAMHTRVKTVDASGNLVATDQLIWRSGDLRGNNNTNGKGGTYYASQMAVIEATKDGMRFVSPLTDVAPTLLGLDGTHLGMQFAVFGTTDKLVPGVTFLSGSHTGGGYSAQVRAVTWDAATGAFADGGMHAIAPYDRHLYPNYLGNNPGNQGRNYANGALIPNPYVGQNGNTDAHLMVFSTSGKAQEDMAFPERKLSAFISVLPLTQTPRVVPPGGGGGSGSGSGSGEELPGTPSDDPNATMGGCSTGGGAGGATSLLLVLGLAARRRRR